MFDLVSLSELEPKASFGRVQLTESELEPEASLWSNATTIRVSHFFVQQIIIDSAFHVEMSMIPFKFFLLGPLIWKRGFIVVHR